MLSAWDLEAGKEALKLYKLNNPSLSEETKRALQGTIDEYTKEIEKRHAES